MVREMISCPWEHIEAFNGWAEFERFESWMREQIAIGSAEERPVMKPYNQICDFKEKWFAHKQSLQVWRLVWPDPPFSGLFEQVIG